jgi:hypothetical protein
MALLKTKHLCYEMLTSGSYVRKRTGEPIHRFEHGLEYSVAPLFGAARDIIGLRWADILTAFKTHAAQTPRER